MIQWLRLWLLVQLVWRSAPGWGNKIPHAVWHGQKLKKKMKNTKGNEYLSFVRNGRLKL